MDIREFKYVYPVQSVEIERAFTNCQVADNNNQFQHNATEINSRVMEISEYTAVHKH